MKRQKLPFTAEIEELDTSNLITPQDAAIYRSIVGMGIYLSQERLDIAYTIKELASKMATFATHLEDHDDDLRAVTLWHNNVKIERDNELKAGDYFLVRSAFRECKRPRLDQQLSRMNRLLTHGQSLTQRHFVRREVMDVYEVYQRYSPFHHLPPPGHWFTGLRTVLEWGLYMAGC